MWLVIVKNYSFSRAAKCCTTERIVLDTARFSPDLNQVEHAFKLLDAKLRAEIHTSKQQLK